jgi:hypothetical protein
MAESYFRSVNELHREDPLSSIEEIALSAAENYSLLTPGNNQGGTAIMNSSLSNDRDFFMF